MFSRSNGYLKLSSSGQSGVCKLHLFNSANVCLIFVTTDISSNDRLNPQPARDSDMDNTVVIHEMGHGISNRMTGGGTARCLGTVEAASMGEGWSDALAE